MLPSSSSTSEAGFTLIELLIVLLIIGSLMAISVTGVSRMRTVLIYKNSLDQVVSDIRYTQQITDASKEKCMIKFGQGSNDYSVYKNNSLIKRSNIAPGLRFYGKSYFSFAPNGYTDVGGSGTLFIGGPARIRKIIVSSRGRIRIE